MNRISVFYEHMAEAMKQENIALDEVCAAVKRFGFDGVELDANRIKNEGDIILPALQKIRSLRESRSFNFEIFFGFRQAEDRAPRKNDRAESLRVIRLTASKSKLQVPACRGGFFDGGRNGARQRKV